MRRTHRETFSTINTEGNLLPVDFLQRIVEGDRELDGLSPESYHLAKNERLNEVINRAWNRCEGVWRGYQSDSAALPETDAGTTTTRERWLLPLFQELGYGRLLTSKARVIDGKSYPISHTWHHTPIHLVSFRQDLDRRTPGVAGAAQMSPHSLVQEFLNRSDDQLWGIVSNGLKLRLLRDNASLTRQAYVEFDLEGMMSGEVYSDFVILYMFLHESRVEAERPEQCWLERWTQETQKRGTRALDQLRDGVEKAIAAFGQGFIAHPANTHLRQKLQSGDLIPHDLYQQILRLVYRLIFLFVAEDRNLLLSPETSPQTRELYLQNYSFTRIRRIAGRLRGTRHGDLWQGLKITFRGLVKGESALGLNPLGGFLFSEEALSDLNDCELINDALLTAVRQLSFTQDKRVLRPVDYRNLGTEELGSVYESLLELHPEVNVSASTFELKIAAGSERKTTGSYYTPSSLINCLLDSALEPVIKNALKKPDPEKALLDLKVVDPASGSGHFLIAAAHRIGKYLAIIRTGEAEPPPEARRDALREVVSHCIYGVDVNSLAVELCKVALWIETLDPGRPLGFLDHHIKCGNSLIGATPQLLEKGIPNDAFKPVEGDDKNIAAAIRKKNEEERKGQQDLFAPVITTTNWQEAVEDFHQWGYMAENAYHQVREKAAQYEVLRDKPAYRHEKQVADLWTAAFFWPLTKESAATVPTEDIFRRFQEGNHELKEGVRKVMEHLAAKHHFLHWHLEFPDAFTMEGRDGFDCVIGNPPWERISLKEREFFQSGAPEIAEETNSKKRRELIDRLAESNPRLYEAFLERKEESQKTKHFSASSGAYPYTGVGDINTYALFPERALQLLSQSGYSGLITQTQLVTEKTYSKFARHLIAKKKIVSCYAFENERFLFPGAHHSTRFILLTIGVKTEDFSCATALWLPEWLKESERIYTLNEGDVLSLNPETGSIPQFRTRRDASIAKNLYANFESLKTDSGIRSGITASRVMHDKDDADVIYWNRDWSESQGLLPILESKTFEQYNHRFATYGGVDGKDVRRGYPRPIKDGELEKFDISVIPRKWVSLEDTPVRFQGYKRNWLLHVRKITNSIASRTVVAAITPKLPNNGSAAWIRNDSFDTNDYLYLLAILNSFPLDYLARQKVAGINLNSYHLYQLPIPQFPGESPKILHSMICQRAFELSYTAYDLSDLARDYDYLDEKGNVLPPFRWDRFHRHKLKCEIDALVAHLFGLEIEELHWILDAPYPSESFRVLKEQEEREFGEYRSKRIVLEYYDAMAEAIKTGRPYQTILDPPPADPRVAHPPKRD